MLTKFGMNVDRGRNNRTSPLSTSMTPLFGRHMWQQLRLPALTLSHSDFGGGGEANQTPPKPH